MNILPAPVPCPGGTPYAFNANRSCCKFGAKRNNVTLNAACDGTNLTATDPLECCAQNAYVACNQSSIGGTCYSLNNLTSTSTQFNNWYS